MGVTFGIILSSPNLKLLKAITKINDIINKAKIFPLNIAFACRNPKFANIKGIPAAIACM